MPVGRGTCDSQGPLVLAVRALEVGNWPRATVLSRSSLSGGPDPEGARLLVLIRVVAAAMGEQARGHMRAAWRQLETAAKILPPHLTRVLADARVQAQMISAQRAALDPHPLLCRVATVIGREQALLDDLRDRLIKEARPRDHLVEAYIHFFQEVHSCAFVWTADDCDEIQLPILISTRADLLRRASSLRQFAFPQRGDVTQSVWRDIGGARGLQCAAMTRLAGRPLTPWSSDHRESMIEVRRGRVRAWLQAQQWQEDLHYY